MSKVVASDGDTNDQFGWSVSIYGNIAVIGSNEDNYNKAAGYDHGISFIAISF